MALFQPFVDKHFCQISRYFHPIVPLTNNCRMNYQSKQAIRVFFARNLSCAEESSTKVTRYVYGPLAVLQSTGAHPSEHYKVFPFTDQLETIGKELSLFLQQRGILGVKFNFLEVKIYLGDDLFMDDNGVVITDSHNKPLKLGCNKVVNSHNDIRFSDDGEQAENDTARKDQPTVTVTVGSTRTIVFERYIKEIGDTGWLRRNTEFDNHIELDHGSVFVLIPQDDKPYKMTPHSTILHKTKHRVEFKSTGVSFAFVFRCVRKTAQFHPRTNRWLWELELESTQNTVKKYLKKLNSKKYIHSTEDKEAKMSLLDKNVLNFLFDVWTPSPTNGP